MTTRLIGLVVALCLLFAPVASAHPTASTFVIILVNGRAVDIQITANGRALALTLEGLSKERLSPPTSKGPAREAIRALSADVLRLSNLTADDARVALAWIGVEDTADPGREGLVTMHLAATLPDEAAVLRWRSSVLLGAYPLAVAAGSASVAPDAYEWVTGSQTSRAYRLEDLGSHASAWSTITRLIPTGFSHIIPGGLDHMLFMLGLFLMAPTRRSLLLQVSAFTLAHSLTLALAVLGVMSAPARLVEPLIAASIAWVAIENLVTTQVSRARLLVVFGFGLLHGLGFAGAMSQLGLSGEHLVASLIGFNAGVELGQLTVIAAAALLVRALRLPLAIERRFILRPASAMIALTGLAWAVQRTWWG